MGLFSSKKKITVGSTLYNLAGDIEDRIQYLPTVINTKIIAGTAQSIGGVIQSSLIAGPGMRMRSFARWARTSGYNDQIGLQQGRLSVGNSIDMTAIHDSIAHAPDEDVVVQTAEIATADYGYWADQWMLENHPERVSANYEIDMDEETNTIKILFDDVVTYTFQPVDFDVNSYYLYYSYMLVKRNQTGPLIPGTKTDVDSEADLPDTSGYTLVRSDSTSKTMDLEDTVLTEVTYSDDRPPESTTASDPHTDSYADIEAEYEKITFSGQNGSGSALLSLRSVQTNFKEGVEDSETTTTTKTEDIGEGVIKTTTVTTTVQKVRYQWAYRRDSQDIVVSQWSPMTVVIYKENSGIPAFDAMFTPDQNMGAFMPFIPLRQWKTFIGDSYQPELFKWTTKAVKKSMDKKIGYINDQLMANDSIGDIDFAYLTYGVSLNTKEKSGLKYIYKFFQAANSRGAGGMDEYTSWLNAWNAANTIQLRWAAWKTAQSDSANPLYGTPEPPQSTYPVQPVKQLRLYSYAANYDMTVSWTGMVEVSGVPGLGRPGAKVGDLWFVQNNEQAFQEILVSMGNLDSRVIVGGLLTLYWQDKHDSYRAISVRDLWHKNIIYKGKGVYIHAAQALADPEESGFIIPLHEGVMRSMSLKDSTQMSTACTYMVLNYYQVTKKKWYQSSWFKIVLIIIVIVIIVLSAGSGTPAAGVLGTAASVGAAVGLAGTAAIIAGAAINAIAGMLIAQLIMRASVALFGPEVGAIIGAIAAVATVSMGTSLANGGTAMAGLQSMTSSVNLLKLTASVGDGVSAAAAGKLEDVNREMLKLQENYKTEIMAVYSAWSENLGFNKGTIDIKELTEASRPEYVYEQLEAFLGRTLMTGSDIAGITNGLISDYYEASITTQLP